MPATKPKETAPENGAIPERAKAAVATTEVETATDEVSAEACDSATAITTTKATAAPPRTNTTTAEATAVVNTTTKATATTTAIATPVALAAAKNTSAAPAGITDANVTTTTKRQTAIVPSRSRMAINPPP